MTQLNISHRRIIVIQLWINMQWFFVQLISDKVHSSEQLPMDINHFLWLVNEEGENMGHGRLWGLYLIKVPITRRSSCDTGLQTQSELTNPPRLLWWRMLLVFSSSKRREVSAHSFWRSRFATTQNMWNSEPDHIQVVFTLFNFQNLITIDRGVASR